MKWAEHPRYQGILGPLQSDNISISAGLYISIVVPVSIPLPLFTGEMASSKLSNLLAKIRVRI